MNLSVEQESTIKVDVNVVIENFKSKFEHNRRMSL